MESSGAFSGAWGPQPAWGITAALQGLQYLAHREWELALKEQQLTAIAGVLGAALLQQQCRFSIAAKPPQDHDQD